MKVELKKLKTYPRLSKETTAFNTELWIDGKKAADVENNGNGGPSRLRFNDPKVAVKFAAYVKSLPPHPSEHGYGPLEMSEDLFVSLLVEKAEFDNRLRRLAKSNVLFSLPGEKVGEVVKLNSIGEVRTVKFSAGDRDGAVKYVLAKYPNAVIHNV